MPKSRCPVCHQPLPEAVTQSQLDKRLQKLALPALAAEQKRLRNEFQVRLTIERQDAEKRAERDFRNQIEDLKRRAEQAARETADRRKKEKVEFERRLRAEADLVRRRAEARYRNEIAKAGKRASDAEEAAAQKVERIEKQIEQRLRTEMNRNVRLATRENEAKLEKLQAQREKERLRYDAEAARLQGQLDNLSRKLEKQSGERLGEEGELDLMTTLERSFPKDRIERIGRGVKGADIIQHVMDGTNCVGRMVYENKNVTQWSNAFINQARKYRSQYETPYVLIVSRAFPKKQRDFCIAHEVPVVRPGMAVALGSVMREGILAIGRLRLSGAGRDHKAQELLQYVLSDKFGTRFKGIGECVNALRDQQRKERSWHENAWEAAAALHDRIDKGHREINAQLDTLLTAKRPLAFAARA